MRSKITEAPRESGSVSSATLTTLRLPSWMYLYLGVALTGWILLTALATQWQPTVITSGSMAPAVRTGDVVFLSSPTVEEVAQTSIVSFRTDDGERLLHRVFSVEDGFYVTKGDANPTPDIEPLAYDRIDGIARLVVPYAGLPVVWWVSGQQLQFGAWLALTIVALLHVLGQVRHRGAKAVDDGTKSPVAQLAIRQVRVLVIFMVVAQYIVDPARFTVVSSAAPPILAMVIIVTFLAVTNLISLRADRTGDRREIDRASLLGLGADTLLVVVMVAVTGSSGIGWILFALPIIEAAARSRLTGALAAWVILTLSTIGLRIAIANQTGTTGAAILDDLDAVMDQLSVLLLIVVPGAYLAEQLLTDVVEHRRATITALDRSALLQQVVDHGRRMTQLDRSLFDTLITAVESLGFRGADVVVRLDSNSPWQILASSASLSDRKLPVPGEPGSAVTNADMAMDAVSIDEHDPNPADVVALSRSGWGAVLRITVPTSDRTVVAVRATVEKGIELNADAVDGLTLLLGQASVGIQNNQLLDDMRSMNERMKYASTHDALTGLPNRVLVMETLAEALVDAGPGSATAVLFLDLNGFKPVNDRLGHDSGDTLLKLVASRLSNQVGEGDQVGRLGGDEFTVVSTGLTSRGEAERLAGVVCEAVANPFVLGSDPVRISAAVGISYAEGPGDPAEMIRQADVAMYRAKTEPRVRIRHYESIMDHADIRAARLAGDLEPALRLGQVQMHFQPVVERTSGRLAGVEALVRWHHPEFGAVPPNDLMAIAEHSGRAAEMNRWILNESLQAGRRIDSAVGQEGFFVAVNASSTEIRLPSFVDHVTAAIELSGLQPETVLIELSEGLVLDDDPIIPRNIGGLTEAGVRVLLDDFGEGKTTLGHLRRLPLVGLKLDRSFLANVDDQPDDEIIIRSIVSMAHELGIGVVAEGVESESHREIADRTGVDLLQGYHCGRPMALQELLAAVDSSTGLIRTVAPSSPSGGER